MWSFVPNVPKHFLHIHADGYSYRLNLPKIYTILRPFSLKDTIMDDEERRQQPRFAFEYMIDLATGRETSYSVEGLDISEGGMLCQVKERLNVGERTSALFTLVLNDERKSVCCWATVTHVKRGTEGYLIGFKFSGLNDEAESVIKNYIAMRETRESPLA